MKKILTVLAVFALLFSQTALAEMTYPVDTSETLTMWRVLDGDIVNAGYTSYNEAPGYQKWLADSGIQVELKEFADNDALKLALQADELPDMFMFDYRIYNGGIMGMVNDGLIIELTSEMFQTDAPDFWTYFTSMPLYKQYLTQLDGKIYNFPSNMFEPNSIYRHWRQFMYRGDMLEEYGLEIPKSTEDFKNLMIYARDNIEGIDVPFVAHDYLTYAALDDGYFTSDFDLVRLGEYQVDGEYHFGMFEETYRDVLAYMNSLYNEGLMSVDFASTDEATAQSAFTSGSAIAIFCNNSRINTLKVPTADDGGYIVAGGPLHRADQDEAYFAFADPYVTSQYSIYITTESKKADLCLQFLNYLFTEQGNLLRNFGTADKSYTFVDNQPTYTDYITKNADGYSLDVLMRAEALINWPGIHSDRQLEQRHPDPMQLKSYQAQSTTHVDEYTVIYTGILDEYLDEYTRLWTDIDTYMKECRTRFISGQLNLEDDFDNYIQTLKDMGMDRIIEIKQATLDAFYGN